ncbi:Sec-independent protein translocase protein TatB [Luteimonas saliphila]|uniref:Sec-independent protein translocase protein TatB n=1 Tax=Luteimonas saliphila TaxID=2804919 RepID=UPI001EE2D582|nr:Sec-independent protein translocase protein TatB [Luteimonas saliphila]
MFDIGFTELLLVAVVALVVLGPERLPKAARFAGLWVRRARAQWVSVKSELERELAAEELKRSLHDAKQAAAGLQRTMQETEAEVQAKVRAAEAEARREIESLRRQASPGLADQDATAVTEATTAAALAAPETPQRDAPQPDAPQAETRSPPRDETPHQPDLLAGRRDDTDTDDGRQR